MTHTGGRGLARRLRIALLGAALIALATSLTLTGTALADTRGASTTTVWVIGDTEIGYGETLSLMARVDDTSDSCNNVGGVLGGCDWPYGQVDFYAVKGATQLYLASGDLGAEPVIPQSTTDVIEFCCLEVGSYDYIRGYYVPSNFDPSSGTSDPVTVTRNGSTITLEASTTTPTLGAGVSFDIHLAGYSSDPNAIKPGGTVDVYEGSTNYGTAFVDSNGDATIMTTQLPLGHHELRARWGGDAHWTASTSASVGVTVGGGTTSTTLVTSTTSTTYGAPVTLTATVTAVDPPVGTPTGGVGFRRGLTAVGTATLDEGSPNTATLTTSELPVGSHIIFATYAGDGVYLASPSNTVTVNVAKAATTTTLSSSANPSAFGQPVTITATVDGPGTTTVPGTVQFKDGTQLLGSPQSLVLGQASLTIASLGGGSHAITAVYSGSDSYTGSTSSALTQTVTCTQTITGTVSSVTTTSGSSTCLSGAKVSGRLTVAAGSSLSIVNSTVTGSVTVAGATSNASALVAATGSSAALTICGSTLGGNLKVSGMGGFVLVGDRLEDACAGNTIKGTVTLSGNTGGLAIAENRVGGGVTVSRNIGAGLAGHEAPEVEANRIGGYLSCSGNSPAVTDDGRPNDVRGWAVFG
jgi:hypothetical protein